MLKSQPKKHFLSLFAASAMILALMTSCSSSAASKSSDEYRMEYANDYSINESVEFDEDTMDSRAGAKSTDNAKSGDKTADQYEDKIIRTANLTIESSDAQKCYDTLAAFAVKHGGREISVSKSSDTYDNYDYIHIEAELKILPEKLNDFIALAEKTDKVTSSEISTNDITREYYDVKLRLEAKKETLKSYYKLLKEASTIEEALEVQRYISDLTAEIESMEGLLKYYDSKVDLSTIHLSIRQEVKLHVGAKDDFQWDSLSLKDFITLIKNGFLSVLNFLWSLLLWLIIIIIAVSPLLLIAGIVFFCIRRWRKKHPKKPKAQKQAQPVNMYYAPVPVSFPPSAPAAPAEPQEPQEKK